MLFSQLKKILSAVRGLYQARIDSLDKTIKLLEEEDGNSAALRSVTVSKRQFPFNFSSDLYGRTFVLAKCWHSYRFSAMRVGQK